MSAIAVGKSAPAAQYQDAPTLTQLDHLQDPSRNSLPTMTLRLQRSALDQLFYSARTYNGWMPTAVTDDLVRELYDLLKWAPTAANSNPARFVWVRTPEAKDRLAGVAADMNRPKIIAAPLTVIIGSDFAFANTLPKLLPPFLVEQMQMAFADPKVAESSAARNCSLQGAYLMLAARALGLDCGPMSGFDSQAVDALFFGGTQIRSNFICSIGYGDSGTLHPRLPRLTFEEASWFQ